MSGKLQLSCIVYPIFMIFILAIISCSSSTEVNKGSLSGTVQLEGEADHSGITIALYQLVELDPQIVDINLTYPQIGVIINQQTEFDHRLANPSYSVETNSMGEFSINDIELEDYNIVISKEGWGYKYILDYNFNKKDSRTIEDINLYKADNLGSESSLFPDSTTTFYTDHHYLIEGNMELLPDQELIIEPGAVIRLKPGKSLFLHGSVKIQGDQNNFIWFTCENLSNTIGNRIGTFGTIEVSIYADVQDNLINWVRIDNSTNCLLLTKDGVKIYNSVFRDSHLGLQINNLDYMECKNSLFHNCFNDTGILLDYVISGEISRNIIIGSVYGIHSTDDENLSIDNNYLADNDYGIYAFGFDGVINNNEFNNNLINDIYAVGGSTADPSDFEILYNVMNCVDNIVLTGIPNANHRYFSIVSINNNNFFDTENYFLKYGSQLVFNYVDVSSNYFNGISNLDNILLQILDFHSDQYDKLVINNFNSNPISGAGIQN